jgi:hypothetical protein
LIGRNKSVFIIMSCNLEIGFSEFIKDKVFFMITNCGGMKSFSGSFPKDKTKFFEGGIEAEGGKQYIVVEENGNVEYMSSETEITLNIPTEIAIDFIEYVKQRVGKPVTEEVEFKESENPQGGKRRKTRRNKSKCRKSKYAC